jgi:hypothetical protein
MRYGKGFVGLPLMMLVSMIAVISVILFFLFFKIHLTSLITDVDSINRYQEIPTTILSSYVLVGDSGDKSDSLNRDTSPKEKINCFDGDGPAGRHGPNEELCTKRLSIFFSKESSSVGEPVISANGDSLIYGLDQFKNNLRMSLPTRCFAVAFSKSGEASDLTDAFQDTGDAGCNMKSLKINQKSPIPVMRGSEPGVLYNVLSIGSNPTSGDAVLVTWPRYDVRFDSKVGDLAETDVQKFSRLVGSGHYLPPTGTKNGAVGEPVVNGGTPTESPLPTNTPSPTNVGGVCDKLAGSGSNINFVIVPCWFEGSNRGAFDSASGAISESFTSVEPYKSNLDKFSIYKVSDFRAADILTKAERDGITAFDITTVDSRRYVCMKDPIIKEIASQCADKNVIVISLANGLAIASTSNGVASIPISVEYPLLTAPSVALHETGHALGLQEHSCIEGDLRIDLPSLLYKPTNCAQKQESENKPCAGWQGEEFTKWVLPGDPKFGCYQVCSNIKQLYRPWKDAKSIMCGGENRKNGFTPVERKILYDRLLNGLAG